jgi:hypothetical protein
MDNSETIGIIRDSFESWYNSKLQANERPVAIVINYSDLQTLAIKAYHTVKMEVQAVGIREGKSFIIPLLKLQENYNHGVTSEQEAKDNLTKKMLIEMFNYPESKVVCKG